MLNPLLRSLPVTLSLSVVSPIQWMPFRGGAVVMLGRRKLLFATYTEV